MTTDSVATPASKPRWGESEEDDAEGLDYLLPPKQIIGPDENGIEKVIEFKYNDEGNMVKITTTTQAQKLPEARLSKRAIERRSWPKFGDAVREDVGIRLTMVSTEEIFLERPRPTGTNVEEEAKAADARSAVVCRTCGKNHWTSKCPNKDLALQTDTLVENPPISDATKGAYVPPSMRSGADKRRRNDENSVRVANLSEDTREPDLMELFRPFGAVTRVYVVTDQKTGLSRGFGFVNFANKEDAQRAINKLNGYGYDNLILRVEWATPRSN